MDNMNENDIYELNDDMFYHFCFLIDKAITDGNPSIILFAINKYQQFIEPSYIKMAKETYQNLLLEKLNNLSL